jgi:hypothetical protein
MTKKYSNFDISPQLRFEKIVLKKSHSSRAFQQYQELTPIFLSNFIFILLDFLWPNYLIFKNFCTLGLDILKTPWCISILQSFSNNMKSIVGGTIVYKI